MNFGSLFSGIGGFDLGFEQAGLECAWQVEIDKDCQRVLLKQFPNVERFDDVSKIEKLEPVDVICGGFPCQDLSVAGKRAGLAGERSGLWFEFLRIIKSNLPRFVVIENVPGLLSSWSPVELPPEPVEGSEWDVEENSDLEIILAGLSDLGYGVGYRILDAQYFNVAQRRERVFIVGSLGNGSCAEILFESEGLSGNSAPRREARERTTASVKASPPSRRNGGSDPIGDEFVIADCLTRNYGKQPDSSNRNAGPVNLVAATLDQRGRGPTDAVMMNLQVASAVAPALTSRDNKSTREDIAEPAFVVAWPAEVSPPLDASWADRMPGSTNQEWSSQKGGRFVPAIAFAQNQRDEIRLQGDGDIAGALANEPGMKQQTYIAFEPHHDEHNGRGANFKPTDLNPSLRGPNGTDNTILGGGFGVRRLTPRECERLQSFPDDWTRWDSQGKEISDSARYRMLGNAVCVNNAKWIGRRIITSAGSGNNEPEMAVRETR